MSAAPSLQRLPPEIRLEGLAKRFGRKPALQGVDLHLSGAQRVGVVGPDGAGKTTLLRALSGLLEVEARDTSVLGFDLRGDVRALKARVGYVPQSFALNRDLTIAENLHFTGRLHRIPRQTLESRSQELLERTGLTPFSDRPAGALSGGMKQKLAVANALLPDPDLLVLDECTAGVDVLARAEISELLREHAQSCLIVLSTSYLDEAAECDRLVYLDGGRVIATGTPSELRAQVRVALYRVWSSEPREVARAARRLAGVVAVRTCGRYARIEMALSGTTDRASTLRALSELPAPIALVEPLEIDMEATLLALARDARASGEARPR